MGLNKSALMALFLMAVALPSFIAAGFFQTSFTQTGDAVKLNLPTSSVIDYEVTDEVKSALIQNGVTILKFTYSLSCSECFQVRSFLESLVESQGRQLLLEEVVGSSPLPELTVSSYYGEQTIVKMDQNEILKTTCALMIQPPIQCVSYSIPDDVSNVNQTQ